MQPALELRGNQKAWSRLMRRAFDCDKIRTMNNQSRLISVVLPVLLAGGLALLGGVWAAGNLLSPSSLDSENLSATYLAEGREVTNFELVSHTGQPFTSSSLNGQWTLMFFGFTNCPDVCPMTLFELVGVRERLEEKGLYNNVQTVFVTVDPARDTPERLANYVPDFDERFIGVTGSLEQIDRLARDVGIAHRRHDESGEEDYMVDHGSAVLLVNPQGRLQAIFTAPHRASTMAADIERILAFHGTGD